MSKGRNTPDENPSTGYHGTPKPKAFLGAPGVGKATDQARVRKGKQLKSRQNERDERNAVPTLPEFLEELQAGTEKQIAYFRGRMMKILQDANPALDKKVAKAFVYGKNLNDLQTYVKQQISRNQGGRVAEHRKAPNPQEVRQWTKPAPAPVVTAKAKPKADPAPRTETPAQPAFVPPPMPDILKGPARPQAEVITSKDQDVARAMERECKNPLKLEYYLRTTDGIHPTDSVNDLPSKWTKLIEKFFTKKEMAKMKVQDVMTQLMLKRPLS